MNRIDAAAAILVLLLALVGLRRGLAAEVGPVLVWVAAWWLGRLYALRLGGLATRYVGLEEQYAEAAGFLVIVILVVLAGWVLRLLLKPLVQVSFAQKVNRVGGFLAGFVSGCVIATIALALLRFWPEASLRRAVREESLFGRLVDRYAPLVQDRVPLQPLPGMLDEPATNAGAPRRGG